MKLLQNTGTLLTAKSDVTRGGGASGAAAKGAEKGDFKFKGKIISAQNLLIIEPQERNSVNNCYLVFNP